MDFSFSSSSSVLVLPSSSSSSSSSSSFLPERKSSFPSSSSSSSSSSSIPYLTKPCVFPTLNSPADIRASSSSSSSSSSSVSAAMLSSAADDADDEDRRTEKIRQDLLLHQTKVLTLPTILTLLRIVAIPVLLSAFYSNEWWATATVACIFIFAAITDWLDGFLARKMGSDSTFGAFLDPVADKLMVATTLVLLSTKPLHVSWAASLPWIIPLPATVIIGREITMSAVREWAASQGGNFKTAVAVNKLGKWKTAAQMVALTILLAMRNASETSMACFLITTGVGLLYTSAGLALWSLAVYMKGIWRAMSK